tara:strand:+ start:1455 stop:2825 length:1371 start_codon:yes stop_codon:yes gene_type:complete
MKKRLFPLLIALSALLVSGSAAFYSVFGLSKLFAGASTQVIVMAGSLEFAKLVVASLLYQYWDTINKWLRSYLLIACFVLMIITSGGIYGFLSGAYQTTATQSELLDKSLLIINQKQVRFEETKEDLTLEKTQINKSISDLRISLSNPSSVSYWDENSQTVITTTSSSTRRALQAELKTTIIDRDNLNIKLEAVLDSIGKTDMVLLEKEISNEDQRELGPLKYLASTTGWPMDKVVNYFLLLIVFVFDPLAISLVVASNMAFDKIRKPEDSDVTYEESQVETDLDDTIDKDYFSDLQDYIKATTEEQLDSFSHPKIPMDIPTHNPQTGEVNPYYKELTGKENPLQEENEKRMNIIGQNGNDGLHYGNEDYNGDIERLTDTTQTLIVEKKENIRVIKKDTDLTDEERIELSREVGKKETRMEEPINPNSEELEKLAKLLSINKKEDDETKRLRYKGR